MDGIWETVVTEAVLSFSQGSCLCGEMMAPHRHSLPAHPRPTLSPTAGAHSLGRGCFKQKTKHLRGSRPDSKPAPEGFLGEKSFGKSIQGRRNSLGKSLEVGKLRPPGGRGRLEEGRRTRALAGH